jgi:predicted alpha/beta superfamily hydrolase
MTTKQWLLALATTATLFAAATFLAREILGDEPAVPGALPDTLRSAILGEDREYLVHLPAGYGTDTSARYPVLYVLDGTSQSGHTAESAALLARIGTIPPLIVVGVPSVDGETRDRDYTPPDMRLDTDEATSPMGEADRFLAFLRDELIGRVEQQYRTTRPRMLAGWSRGGLFVVYSQLAAPALFEGRFAHSPALWREGDLIATQLREAGDLNAGLLYLSLGDAENEKMTAAFRHTVEVLRQDPPPGLRWRADFSAGGDHGSNPRLSTPVGLCEMFSLLGGPGCRGAGIVVAGSLVRQGATVPAR